MRTGQGALRTTIVLAAAALAAAAAPSTPPAAPPACTSAQPLESLHCLINRTRAERGLAPVRMSPLLTRSARLRGTAIARCRDFSHTPCGQSFRGVFRSVGYARGSFVVGENLAWGTGVHATPELTLQRWLASPPHRRVLLSPRWRELGAYVLGAENLFAPGSNRLWVAQFGRRG